MQPRGNGRWVEKGVDVGVALDVVLGAFEDRWDTAVVVTGDGDIARAGRLARALGKGFEAVCCERTLSAALAAEANSLTTLTADVLEGFVY